MSPRIHKQQPFTCKLCLNTYFWTGYGFKPEYCAQCTDEPSGELGIGEREIIDQDLLRAPRRKLEPNS